MQKRDKNGRFMKSPKIVKIEFINDREPVEVEAETVKEAVDHTDAAISDLGGSDPMAEFDYGKLAKLLPKMKVVREYDLRSMPSNYAIDLDDPNEPDGQRTNLFRLPDGCLSAEHYAQAQLVTLLPELLECLTKHCEWCADCPFDTNPDPTCGLIAEVWKRIIDIMERVNSYEKGEDVEKVQRPVEES